MTEGESGTRACLINPLKPGYCTLRRDLIVTQTPLQRESRVELRKQIIDKRQKYEACTLLYTTLLLPGKTDDMQILSQGSHTAG